MLPASVVQRFAPLSHAATHAPFVQSCPVGQLFVEQMHAPFWQMGSVVSVQFVPTTLYGVAFAQSVPVAVCPHATAVGAGVVGVQLVQVPLMHVCDPVHVCPHVPQLLLSVVVLTHAVPQRVVPPVHVHCPFVHVDPVPEHPGLHVPPHESLPHTLPEHCGEHATQCPFTHCAEPEHVPQDMVPHTGSGSQLFVPQFG